MKKNYYENRLANQNHIAKSDVAWCADITSFEIRKGKKIYVYFCLDIFSNRVLVSLIRSKPIKASEITQQLNKVIEKRFPILPNYEVIIHTDRGTQFSSQEYKEFLEENKGYIIGSMSRPATPKDNPVAERFMRTFKNHKVEGKTFQEEIFYQLEINSRFRGYRKIFNLYVKSLNLKPNTKSSNKAPIRHDIDNRTASMLMVEPKYSKAFSELYGPDFRRDDIAKFKSQNAEVVSILDEIAAKKTEIVDKTPFDLYEDNLAFQVIDERLQAMYALIQSNPELTREYVEDAVQPLQAMIESVDEKINILLPKRRKDRNVLTLRDPVDTELFDVFINAAGSNYQRQLDLKSAQLRIAYTILFFAGLRVNEIRCFKEKDIQDAIKTGQFNVIHFKQKEAHVHVISDQGVQELKKLKLCYEIVFVKYKYNFLFGKDKPIAKKSLIRTINNDLKHTCQINEIPYNIKSHSFRINMIAQLLRNTSVQNAADVIGHRDIKSTMAYKRYALNKKEIQELLNKIDQQKEN